MKKISIFTCIFAAFSNNIDNKNLSIRPFLRLNIRRTSNESAGHSNWNWFVFLVKMKSTKYRSNGSVNVSPSMYDEWWWIVDQRNKPLRTFSSRWIFIEKFSLKKFFDENFRQISKKIFNGFLSIEVAETIAFKSPIDNDRCRSTNSRKTFEFK